MFYTIYLGRGAVWAPPISYIGRGAVWAPPISYIGRGAVCAPPISGEVNDVNTIIKENNPIVKIDFFIIWDFISL